MIIELKSVLTGRRCYVRKYGSPATFANSLSGWFYEFQAQRTMPHRSNSGGLLISNDDVAKVENSSQENPRESQRPASSELGIQFSLKKYFTGKSETGRIQDFFCATTLPRRISSETGLCTKYLKWTDQWFWIPVNNCLL